MRRRAFIKVIVGSAATWPFVARAQQPQRVRRIGLLMGQAESNPESSPRAVAFRQALNRLGWKERFISRRVDVKIGRLGEHGGCLSELMEVQNASHRSSSQGNARLADLFRTCLSLEAHQLIVASGRRAGLSANA